MELNIVENKKNEALKRADIIAEVDEKLIPSRDEIRKNISAQLNIPVERIIIRQVASEFGKHKVVIKAKIYDNAADTQITERKYMNARNVVKDAPKQEVKEETAKAINDVETESNDVAEQATAAKATDDAKEVKAVNEAKEETKSEEKVETKEEPKAEKTAEVVEEAKTEKKVETKEEPKAEKKDGE